MMLPARGNEVHANRTYHEDDGADNYDLEGLLEILIEIALEKPLVSVLRLLTAFPCRAPACSPSSFFLYKGS